MELGLAGRVYLLTGASRGLGFATAQHLVEEGAKVVISARDADRLSSAIQRLGGERHAVGVEADLGDAATPQRLITAAVERFDRIDGALISVGGPPPGTALATLDEQWMASFQTIFLGAARAARAIADRLDPGGVIGLVLSTSARAPIPGLGISNGLRPGLLGIAKDMADELAPRGIRVVSLLPGRIRTDRTTELLAATQDPQTALAAIEAAIPMRRMGTPEEFAKVATFLLSPAASYLTGIAVPVDGGALRAL